jgi:hypothetical protein
MACNLIPTIVGWRKQNHGAILALNLFLGWTLVGWVVALVWAMTNDAPEPKVVAQQTAPASNPPAELCAVCRQYSQIRGDNY